MDTPLIELRAIRKSYTFGKVGVTALRKVTMEIDASEFVALSGALDTGKTTLLTPKATGCIDKCWKYPGRGLSRPKTKCPPTCGYGCDTYQPSGAGFREFVLESPKQPEHNAISILEP